MKNLFAILSMMLFVSATAFAQEPATPAGEEATGGPIMTFETMEVDYGMIEQGSDPYRFFSFTNTGDTPLLITSAKGSCGCTVPTYPQQAIAPGETGEIKVRYDTNRIGKFTKTVTLTTNETESRRVLRIRGEVEKKPEEPAAIPESTGGF